MSKTRPVVAVVFGGRSSEHSISCLSADSVMAAIDRTEFEVVPVGITRDGRMFLQNNDPDSLFNNSGELPEVAISGQQVVFSTDPTVRGFVSVDGSELHKSAQSIDVVFSLLHGPFGEDGSIQGALEFGGMPYVGSGVFSSAVSMDKVLMKNLFVAAGLKSGPFVWFRKSEWTSNPKAVSERVATLKFPVFVKPARAGSSIGITKVKSVESLAPAIEAALKHDQKIIVEQSLENIREIECGILVDEHGVPQPSVPAEIVVRGNHDFYDFEAKYLEDSAELHVPAVLTDAQKDRVQAVAIEVFKAVDCEGFARCDFFLTNDDEVFVNEVNTLPGFTSISMFPRMWLATGLNYQQIVRRLILDGIRKGTGLR
jgi:D-alanine-D-alanine ligase